MSKHHKYIIDIIKNEEEESNERFGDWKDFLEHHQNGEDLTEQEYIDILSGNHAGLSSSWLNSYMNMAEDGDTRVGDLLNRSKHNNPATNEKVIEAALEERKGWWKGDKEKMNDWEERWSDGLSHLSKRGNLSGRSIDQFIDDSLLDPRGRDNKILANPNITRRHLEDYGTKNPEQIEYVLDHELTDNNTLKNLFNNPEFREGLNGYRIDAIVQRNMQGYNRGKPIPDKEQSTTLDPNIIHTLLEDHSDEIRPHSLDLLLDHADPTFKKNWVNSKLGIDEGGTYGHTFPEDYEGGENSEAFQEENWANWSIADLDKHGYNERLARHLAGSRHIDDEQAEHIKRHSNIEEKYALYENKHVDPRHGVEMFQKWNNDDHHHGYDSDELNAYHKEHKDDIYTIDELDPEIVEEIREEGHNDGSIRESAEESYSVHDYVRDNEDKIVDMVYEKGAKDELIDRAHEILHEDYSDWEYENPNSSQNVGNPVFDKLNDIYEEYGDSGSHLTPQEAGVESWSEIGIPEDAIDADGDVHIDDISEELNKFGGPLMIGHDHDDFDIAQHPEYEDRFGDALKEAIRKDLDENAWEYIDDYYLYEDHMESPEYQEAEEEAAKWYIEQNAKNHMEELYNESHNDVRFIPSHLHPHIPNYDELYQQQRTKQLDGIHKDFLNTKIKDRSYDHEYADNQHHHEMVRDYAQANGGKIDIGTMNKLYPNQKDIWKQVFDGKGKITSEEIENKINELPKTKYEISYGKWGSGAMQNVNGKDQVIMRLDHSNESIKPIMEDPDMYDTFKRVQDVSQRSGHPTRNNTIAWARVDTSDPKHWMIDEVQSDFGKTVQRYLKKEGAEHKASHVEKISDYHKNWRESLINAVLKEAKKHGAEKVSTHSPESKHAHAAGGSAKIHSTYKKGYKQVPRSMGFQPANYKDLPLTEKGKGVFIKEGGLDTQFDDHKDAYLHHWTNANLYQIAADKNKDPEVREKALDFSNQHMGLADKHMAKLKTSGKELNITHPEIDHPQFEDDFDMIEENLRSPHLTKPREHNADRFLDKPFSQNEAHQGHTYNLTPKLIKKSMDEFLELYETLEKGEGFNALKGGMLALGLMHGAHYMGQDSQKEAAQQFTQNNIPKHARSVASIEPEQTVQEHAYNKAKKEADDIIYRNEKKGFIQEHGDKLSPHVYKQTIKNNPDLQDRFGYVNQLSNSAFKEVTQKNGNLKAAVHDAHYDKLHAEFGGDYDKMKHAWENGIKSTHSKFRAPASETAQLGEQPSPDKIGAEDTKPAPEAPNFTHRRMFRGGGR